MAEPSGNPPGPPHAARTPHACRTRTLRMPAKTPLAGDKIDAPAACAVPFRPYCGGVVTRTRNVSEYMLVLAVCLVIIIIIIIVIYCRSSVVVDVSAILVSNPLNFRCSADQQNWQNESVPVVTATKTVSATPSSTNRPFKFAGTCLGCVPFDVQ